jgi:hypothetical protein
MYCLTILEVLNQGLAELLPSEDCEGRICSQASLLGLQMAIIMFTWHLSYVFLSVQMSPFYKDTSRIELRVHSNPVWPHLNYICNHPISK